MVAFFSSFRSSSMPKRLLRYALSRLELLDTEALDIDNLDLALGKRTLLEFRDVGMRLRVRPRPFLSKSCSLLVAIRAANISLQKLHKLLQLPAGFQVQKATILLLRVTIPMDFYSTPILIDVDGIDVIINFDRLTRRHSSRTARMVKPTSAADVVPTPVEMAQSFLETETPSERIRLETALNAETVDLGVSVTASEDGADDDLALGTGQALSLPVFLADFLQGILDRVQVSIQRVTLQLDTNIATEANPESCEPVSVKLTLEALKIDGASAAAPQVTNLPSVPDHEARTPIELAKEGTRHIVLNKIRTFLVARADLFSSLDATSSMMSKTASSPGSKAQTSHSHPRTSPQQFGSHGNPSKASATPLQSSSAMCTDMQLLLTEDSEEALAIPYDFDVKVRRMPENGEPSTPKASSPQALGQDVQELLSDSALVDESSCQQSQLLYQSRLDQEAAMSDSAHSLDTRRGQSTLQDTTPSLEFPPSSRRGSCCAFCPVENLAASHIYTHNEATSMYMSAFSNQETPGQEPPSHHQLIVPSLHAHSSQSLQPEPRPRVPGAWEDQSTSFVTHSSEYGAVHAACLSDSESVVAEVRERTNLVGQDPSKITELSDVTVGEGNDDANGKPARVLKEVMQVDHVSVLIPPHIYQDRMQASCRGTLQPPSDRLPTPVDDTTNLPDAAIKADGTSYPPKTHTTENQLLSVEISPLSFDFDDSAVSLLIRLVNELVKANEPGVVHDASRARTEPNSPGLIKVVAQQISVNFVQQLIGSAGSSKKPARSKSPDPQSQVFLSAKLDDFQLAISSSPDMPASISTKVAHEKKDAILTTVAFRNFRLGHSAGDIIAFDSSQSSTLSGRDSLLAKGYDVGVKMTQTRSSLRTEVDTQPLIVKLELQRLDEILGWVGGLSDLLETSTSKGTQPVQGSSKRLTPVSRKSRSVHFDTLVHPHNKLDAAKNKLNIRLNGIFTELSGRDFTFQAESNAVKIVSRDEGVGLTCSSIRLAGPYLRTSGAEPVIKLGLNGVRLEILMAPKDRDLEKLLELIIPSRVQFGHERDEIMVDTLLRQRRKGSVLRTTIEEVNVRLKNLPQLSTSLSSISEELAKLSAVIRYLPEDDRSGLLTLIKISKLSVDADVPGRLGYSLGELRDVECAHITVPSLIAVAVRGVSARVRATDELVSSSYFDPQNASETQCPAIMIRVIGEEMEPTIKVRLHDVRVEYDVTTVVDLLGLKEDSNPQDFEAGLATSIASLGTHARKGLFRKTVLPTSKGEGGAAAKPFRLDLGFKDCRLGLNPLGLKSKLIVVLTDAQLIATLAGDDEMKITTDVRKASLLLIDDVTAKTRSVTPGTARRRSPSVVSPYITALCDEGFVDICYISAACVTLVLKSNLESEDGKQVEVEVRDDLLVLETCADSTQTLLTLANALKPPTPPSKQDKFRTTVVPVQDLLASISAEAFGKSEGEYDFDQDFAGAQEMAKDVSDVALDVDSFVREAPGDAEVHTAGEELFDAGHSLSLSGSLSTLGTIDGVLLSGFAASTESVSEHDSDGLVIYENFYGQESGGRERVAQVWNSTRNSYDRAPDTLVKRSPIKVAVREVHIIWNLFDGYDWPHTREVITKAVDELEAKAIDRQTALVSRAKIHEVETGEEETIGDFLFNSIYIGIPANRDPGDLARAINEGLDDNTTETESITATSMTGVSHRTVRRYQPRSRRLRLNRSKRHKITFELQGVNIDMIVYPPESGQETLSSIDVRVRNLEIFDHVPTSTWKKFATYDQDYGEREMGTGMVHLELMTVRPIAELAASEFVLRITVLPLRLHVDQDALDFISRFFEFKDDQAPMHASPNDVPFLQRAEVNDVPVKLDFKPKRVDYAGLRSGHTTEFMNFIVLEEARMVMRHVIIYGVAGFDRFGKTLNDIWMPDIRNNQLPGVVAGLAPVRSLVNIGSGLRDLIEIPLKEYRKDGRVIRSISKGAAAFARNTGTELVKLGAKIAVGTQYALQGAEEMLTEPNQPAEAAAAVTWDDLDEDDDNNDANVLDSGGKKQISLYADQPTGVLQGLRGGYRSLARDVTLAKDAIVAVPGEVMESRSAVDAARAVWKRTPTIVFRPAVGASRAIGQTFLGATNSIDPENKRRVGEKYKH